MSGATTGILNADMGGLVLGLAGLAVVAGAASWWLRARAKNQAHVEDDARAYEVPGLGTIMADGGRPIRDAGSVQAWSPWDDERELEVGE
jgi:hypothetical protein